MGRAVLAALDESFAVCAAFVRRENALWGRTLREAGLGPWEVPLRSIGEAPEALREADVVLSFATARADLEFVSVAAEVGTPAVVGTTGFTSEDRKRLIESAADRIPLVLASNFSMGIAVLRNLLPRLAPLRGRFDASLVEMHHGKKRDAPSGTALVLAEDVQGILGLTRRSTSRASPRVKSELEVVSLRGGGVPGEHALILAGPHEVLRIEHRVFSRAAFASGALRAAAWAATGPPAGLYSFEDVLRHEIPRPAEAVLS